MTKKKKKVNIGQIKGFRKEKKPTKKQLEIKKEAEKRRNDAKAFFEAYTKICIKFGMQIDVELHTSKMGILPRTRIMPHYEKEGMIKNRFLFIVMHKIRRPFLILFRKKRFMKEYAETCREHRVQLGLVTEITDRGIFPKINLVRYAPKPEIKDWDEAKKENDAWDKEAEADRKTMTQDEFAEKWPDRPYKLQK